MSSQEYSIKGSFPQAKQKELQLVGYNGFKDTLLFKTITDNEGNFLLHYPKKYKGAALLQIKEMSSLIVLLNQENFELQWQELQDFKNLKIINSPENSNFAKGIEIYQDTESKLSGLKYLGPIYQTEKRQSAWIEKEIELQEARWPKLMKELPINSYASYYLDLRKLLNDMPITNSRYPERIVEHEAQFKSMDFAADDLYHSGLFKELIMGYFQLLESHDSIEAVVAQTNSTIDMLLKGLKTNPGLQQEVAFFLFKHLEKRSLFKNAEYLALSMLNQKDCLMDTKASTMFEQYRKMAIGAKAPNIDLEDKNLYSLNNQFKLVIFGSSLCPACKEEYPTLKANYLALKSIYDLEMLYVSLDTDIAEKEHFFAKAPFTVVCDYKGWETQPAKDYYIFGTPTMLLLDSNNTILLKPNNTEHLEAWLRSRDKK